MPLFENASHLLISGGNFTEIHSVTHHPSDNPDAALLHHCAMEATHESSTAAYAPKCKPGTREKVIGDIMNWVDDKRSTSSTRPIVWFSGPAGGGKTCIMREIARRSQDSSTLAASYFFSTRLANLHTSKPFVVTIAQQLLEKIPSLRPLVVQAILRTPGIFSKSLDIQAKALIFNPVKMLVGRSKRRRKEIQRACRLISIDGLDECTNESERSELLRLLHILVSNPHFPFRVIISSRPEYDIRTAFTCQPLQSLTCVVRLDEYDGNNDIRHFLCDEFARIRESHPSRLSIPPTWPSEEEINEVVIKSSSQFIFAATVVKYVDSRHHDPMTSLQRVLDLLDTSGADSRDPFSELDRLYHLILHPPNIDLEYLRRLLHFIGGPRMAHIAKSSVLRPNLLDEFFGLGPGTTDRTICDLHSVISVPSQHDGNLKFHHKSIDDYIFSSKRGGNMYQPQMATFIDLLERCFHHTRCWSDGTTEIAFPVLQFSTVAAPYYTEPPLANLSLPILSNMSQSILDFNPAILLQVDLVEDLGRGLTGDINFLRRMKQTAHRWVCASTSEDSGVTCSTLCKRLGYIDRHRTKIDIILINSRDEPREVRVRRLPELNAYAQWSESREPCDDEQMCMETHEPREEDHLHTIPIPPKRDSPPLPSRPPQLARLPSDPEPGTRASESSPVPSSPLNFLKRISMAWRSTAGSDNGVPWEIE